MAWIKMNAGLSSHPKVIRMASALKADRLRIVGGLHAVWCLFDVHSVDGTLDGYTQETLDELIGWPGFAAAMIKIEWLEDDGESLITPRFDEHNGQSAKRRAMDAERKRAERAEDETVSASEADKKRTREEKRREELKTKSKTKAAPASPAFDPLPELLGRGVSEQTAADWLAHRKAKRALVTQTALAEHIAEADKAGMSLERALAMSCQRGWVGFEASWAQARASPGGPPPKFDPTAYVNRNRKPPP